MDKAKFILDYLYDLRVNKNIYQPDDVVKYARQEINEIQAELKKMDELRFRQILLLSVINQYEDPKSRKSTIPIPDLGDDSDEQRELRVKICKLIEENGPLTNREIINKIADYQKDSQVILAIKWLGEHNIVKRQQEGSETKIGTGDKWEDRNNI